MLRSRLALWLNLIAAGLVLGACAEVELAFYGAKGIVREGPAPAKGIYKIGNPYQIDGVWYYPGEDYGYAETGIASWYGVEFHGKTTANGEIFNMNALTAAHRTLPMPSLVRVTNLENGRAVVVRVNDRGPFNHGRVIDVSRRTAQLLGFERQGTAKVRVKILPEESRSLALMAKGSMVTAQERMAVAAAPLTTVISEPLPPPPGLEAAPALGADLPPPAPAGPPPATEPAVWASATGEVTFEPVRPTNIFVQAGAFTQYDNANRLRARLSGLGPTRVTQVEITGQLFFRVRLGPIASVGEADRLLAHMIDAGYPEARIVVD